MLNFLKSIGSPNDPPPAVGEEKKHTRFSNPEDLQQLRDSKKFTRSSNRHVRERVECDHIGSASQLTQSHLPKPHSELRPMHHVAQHAKVEVRQTEVVTSKTPSDVPISPDVLRKALPQRFAAMKIKQLHQNTFAT